MTLGEIKIKDLLFRPVALRACNRHPESPTTQLEATGANYKRLAVHLSHSSRAPDQGVVFWCFLAWPFYLVEAHQKGNSPAYSGGLFWGTWIKADTTDVHQTQGTTGTFPTFSMTVALNYDNLFCLLCSLRSPELQLNPAPTSALVSEQLCPVHLKEPMGKGHVWIAL